MRDLVDVRIAADEQFHWIKVRDVVFDKLPNDFGNGSFRLDITNQLKATSERVRVASLKDDHRHECQNVDRPRSQNAGPARASCEDYETQSQQRRQQTADGVGISKQHQRRG